ncbi:MAG: type II secretion system GspH family protein [Deferribacteraceae bacterium]|jgi:prepilin-type N-terminal cleavage/methylation domain-containing protein|nr:type II secretion system GspH family protein [Deferribacteraceae bacterium]
MPVEVLEVKKGFTLVELAIVLVIIGLITGMAVKGRSLAAAAEMREEVNKMRKYEHAFATHFAKSGSFVPATYDDSNQDLWSDNVSEIFLEKGYLVSKDLVMKYSTRNPPKTYFIAELQDNTSNPGMGYHLDREAEESEITNFGVLLDKSLDYFICSIEIMGDDRDITTGLGRVAYRGLGSALVNFTDHQYADCSEFSATSTQMYGYVVFSY